MEIISHRGYWKKEIEKNSQASFIRSFELGFGTETDVRDYQGELVISHDIADRESMPFNKFLEIYTESNCSSTLAINIKSDGLQDKLSSSLKKYNISNYFIFDSSIPDTVKSIENHLSCFLRYSEFEPKNSLWDSVDGIWFDRFSNLDLDLDMIVSVLKSGKRAAIVSDELHQRDSLKTWEQLSNLPEKYLNSDKLILCTDQPEQARSYFYG